MPQKLKFNFCPGGQMSEKKKRSKQPKEKKLSKRQVAANERVTALAELAAEAKALCTRAEQHEKTARELGELLLKVKQYSPHGGLRKWIREQIGDDVATRNRCNYALSLANPNSKRNQKRVNKNASPTFRALKALRRSFSFLALAVDAGDSEVGIAMRDTILSSLEKLMKLMAANRHKKLRRYHLDNQVAAGKELSPAAQAELAELSDVERALPHVSERVYDEAPSVAARAAKA
jgi:hypothetical protein